MIDTRAAGTTGSAESWNHVNLCVAPQHLSRLCEAVEALFPWELVVRRPDLVGYRLGDDLHRAALYLRPAPAAAAVHAALARLGADDAGLGSALAALDAEDTDVRDHWGVRIATVAEWERRVAAASRLAHERPELAFEVVRVLRPGDPGAPTSYLHQAWLRFPLLGLLRNTIELQTGA
jgi:hypothetical protein